MGISTVGVSASSGYKKYTQTFNSSTTWTAPAGVTQVDVALVGGGGGGGAARSLTANANNKAIGGGGAGGIVQRKTIDVAPGATYSVVVGSGGGGASNADYSGANGGYSSFAYSGTLANAFFHSGELNASIGNSNINYSTPAVGGWFGTTYNGGGYNLTNPTPYTSTNYTLNGGYINNSDVTNLPAGVSRRGFYITNLYPNGVSNQYGDVNNWAAVTAGTTYTANAYFTTNSSGSFTISTAIRIEWYNAYLGTFISATNGTAVTLNASTNFTSAVQLTATGTAPAGATYALIRYQGFNPSQNGNGFRFHGAQFEEGSSPTSYKTLGTNGTIFNGTSIYTLVSGILASGGGGGGSANIYSGYNTIAGIGGGAAFQGAVTDNYTAGHGGGYTQAIPSTMRLAASTTGTAYQNSFTNDETYNPLQTRPMPVVRYGTNAYHAMGTAPGNSPEGWGAGGIGGWNGSGSVDYIYSGIGAGLGSLGNSSGGNALANSGAGGGGAMVPAVAASYSGGNGGSGQVIISWMGA